ncbi:hypothetical protein [Nocardia neocaledoniensis]|uniref:hypothetical protein n=1 Tax=Nocardia neocaledoniensis TaxID=236511 RepID=UPI002458C4D4|nr:hypothetical protein [Nocardia neocaledoniensis]
MAPDDVSEEALEPNPLVSRLLAADAESAITLIGFTGPAGREGFLRVFPMIHDMSRSIEVAKSDVLRVEKLQKSDFGAVAVWVRRTAELHHHLIEQGESYAARTRACMLRDVNRDGLRMKAREIPAEPRDVCTCEYYCDGTRCVPCTC